MKVSGTSKEYCELVSERLKYLQELLFDLKRKKLSMLNKEEFFQYMSRDLVYIISPLTSQFGTSSRKLSLKYVGHVVVHYIDPKSFLRYTLDEKVLLGLFEYEGLEPVVI